MELNLIATLNYHKMMSIKPNFSELSRIFGKDRHTIKKMFIGKETKEKKKKISELEQHADEIVKVLSSPGVIIKGTYWYFKTEKNIKCTYDNFKTFVKKNNIFEKAKTSTPHPLYETDPGEQLQVDWVESLKLSTIDGEIIEFNLFSATLGY